MTEERLSEILSHWGVFNSRITEEVFADPHDKEGSNRTGIYIVKMKVHQHIPEWLPLDGLRVKVQYPNMKKQCNGCYENHLRKDCGNTVSCDKIPRPIKNFIRTDTFPLFTKQTVAGQLKVFFLGF